ncbi:hypothetical protein B0H39_002491 [Clostridium beijerinckii]|uniref:hypothetical protein n=1 Tax=Clostridium beijerinckii TaxID=1520 RepID=UPI001494E103|nr:hypothetical protein [Clostridium beijerinckii]NOW84595.1 hypothetical protein [Clostridium beijerinckii]NOW84610.1 hypothetical protein [Clostridium beijerinckii]
MTLNNIVIVQSGNEYLLYLENQILVAHIAMPDDKAYIADAKAFDHITKALGARWGVYSSKKKTQKG